MANRLQAIPEVRQLLTITNVGSVAAGTIWAALGDPHRFTHAKQAARYAGLDPSFVQSGEEFRPGRISKNGNTLLRTALVEVALGLARRDDGPLERFYRCKTNQIGHKKAIVALARKLLIVAWRILLIGEGYRAIKLAAVAREYRVLERLAQQTAPLTAMAASTPHPHIIYTRHRHARTRVPA